MQQYVIHIATHAIHFAPCILHLCTLHQLACWLTGQARYWNSSICMCDICARKSLFCRHHRTPWYRSVEDYLVVVVKTLLLYHPHSQTYTMHFALSTWHALCTIHQLAGPIGSKIRRFSCATSMCGNLGSVDVINIRWIYQYRTTITTTSVKSRLIFNHEVLTIAWNSQLYSTII